LEKNNKDFNFIDSKSNENENKINIIFINSNFLNIKEELKNREINKIT